MTSRAQQMFDVMKSRRVARLFTDAPVETESLELITKSARWATSGGNRHIHKWLVTRDPGKITLIRSFSPGMLVPPPTLIIIMTDLEKAAAEELQMENDYANWVDVGTASMNMMNMVHALGLGACPVTSFSKSGVATVLGLPDHLIPELMIMVGHPVQPDRTSAHDAPKSAPKPVTARDLTYWEEVGNHDPA